MTPTIFCLVTIAMSIAFLVVRRGFIAAMISARLADLKVIRHELNLLAHAGRIDRNSAFFTHYTELARGTSNPPDGRPPSVLVILLFLRAHRSKKTEQEPLGPPRGEEAIVELRGRYRAHAHLIRRMDWVIIDALSYRSLPLWVMLRVMALIFGAAQVARWVSDWYRSSGPLEPVEAQGF